MLRQVIKEANQVEYSLVYILLQENYVFPSKIIINVLDQQFWCSWIKLPLRDTQGFPFSYEYSFPYSDNT